MVIDIDGTALGELHAGVLQAKALHARGEADGDHHSVSLDGFGLGAIGGLDVHLNALALAIVTDLGGLVTGLELHTKLLVVLGDLLGHVLVLIGKNAVHELDDGDVHAEVRQNVGELHADGTSTDDDHGVWLVHVEDLLLVGDDVAAQLHARNGTNHGAGSDDAVIEGDGLTFIIALGNLNGLGILEGSLAVDLRDLVLLHQVMDTLDDALRDLAGALVSHPEVHGNVVTRDAECLGLASDGVRKFRISDQCLRGDTTNVEAHTTPVLLLDNGGLEAQLGCADCCHVSTGTCTEYY